MKNEHSRSKQLVAFTPKSHDNKVHDLHKLLVANTANRVVEDTEKQLHVDINKSIANGAEISVNQ